MGDMKTPDFDDLLAAFDIPDMVDPKATIDSDHPDGHAVQLKPSPSGSTINEDEAHNSSAGHDIGISVIVKNIRNMDPTKNVGALSEENKELFAKAFAHSVSSSKAVNNGILPCQAKRFHPPKAGWKKRIGQPATKHFNQFSPISSAEEYDEEEKNDVDEPKERKATSEKDHFKSPLLVPSTEKQEQNNHHNSVRCLASPSNLTTEAPNERLHKLQEVREVLRADNECNINMKSKTSAKLSSCMAAIAALSAKNGSPIEANRSSLNTVKKPFESDENMKTPEALTEAEPALETAKRQLSKQPASDNSGKCSVASSTDALVIPKVRIKTIKTSSGQIKRTVTHVLPDFEKDNISDGQTAVATNAISASPARSLLPASTATQIPKHMTIKPVATAFLPVCAVKTAGSQVINLKLSNNTTVKATVIPASSVQSASSTILKAANAIQQQAIVVPASSLANAKLVPKAVHLTDLNILPPNTTTSTTASSVKNKKSTHQVKQRPVLKAQPSKKVSKVQLTNSSQSSVVDAFNKVLSSINPVPVYVPNLSPPTSTDIAIPSRGYKCLECGDSFALEKSLSQHYERRSVRIEVTCNHCAKGLVFYNKCSLLSHARGHKDKGIVMQCSHLILKPIPADQMLKRTTSPPGLPDISDPIITSTAQSSEGQRKALSRGPQTTANSLEDHALKPNQTCLKCSECNKKFHDDCSLALHYQQTLDSSGQISCSSCQMLLPSPCSLRSHQRIHQHKSPYICPECGTSCPSLHFQSHLAKDCLHYTRRVGYRCVHCTVVFADAASLKSHIQSSHCELFYKCPLCPMAFKSAPGTHSHADSQHPGVKAGEPKLIYKCSMCDTVFTQQSLLFTHFDQHVANHKVPVFKCPECSIYYAQRQVMLDHIKAIHGTLKTSDGASNIGVFQPLSSKTTNSNSSKGNSSPSSDKDKDGGKVTCQNKEDDKPKVPDNNNKAVRKKTTGYTCTECNLPFSSKDAFVAHMKYEHNKVLKKHPCRLCEKSFNSSHSLCRHNRIKHRGLRKVYACPDGPAENFTKRAALAQRTLMMHSQAEKRTEDSLDESSRQQKETADILKRKQEEDEESMTLTVRDSQPLKKLKVNIPKIHKCAVCGFTSEDITAFHKHIPQHKSNGSSFQCHECGLCYTSHRSQARHLFIVHRLKEPRCLGNNDDESQRENTLDVTDENSDGKPNTQCKVCGKVFETEGRLNTHMRTHGMAFIKAKRLSAAEK
ncbi:zinc finger protein 532 isoform X1 [Synchiropus splendidus]|uniref:zinc finger protein 532 isoform X1 n=2 Tax=Synchiropus splendidus TaxID=270530 RepID=UPI00237D8AE4|nr:zinc finger protein 532 isoform X1 [Synchiropus splendidus]